MKPRARQSISPDAENPSEEGVSPQNDSFPVVAIGASAGGLEAYKEFFHALPADTGMAFVLVQHLDPTHESMLAEIIAKATQMPQLSGVDLAIQMKAVCPACKILLFSGQAETADLLRTARDQGHAFHLLSKPIHPADLLRQIRSQTGREKAEATPSVAISDNTHS